MKRLALALAVLASALPAAAQAPRPAVGVGIGVLPLDSAGILPTIEVYVPITVAPTFRLEPSLGVFTNDQRTGGIDSANVTVGIGAFFVKRVAEPTDVYVGGRLKLNFASADNGFVQEDENDWSIAAAVGGEHYGKLSGALAANDNGAFTSGVAFLRFYFR